MADGNAAAALALGETYDPTIPGARAPVDVAMARAWYEKARDLGSTEATVRLDRLTNYSGGAR